MSSSRREFLQGAGVWLAVPMVRLDQAPLQGKPVAPVRPDSAHGADLLADPARVGRASQPMSPLDNDPSVIAIERKLRCSCGCTLDVYTCRTTDFTCTYSPAMHTKVIAQVEQGATPDQIVQWFVAQPEYGEKVLMAPPAQGFNLAGYLLPGIAVFTVGVGLIAYLTRRRALVAAAAPVAPPSAPVDEAQRERLRRALDEVDG